MAVPVQTSSYAPPYFTMIASDSDAGTYSIILSNSQVNFEQGFTIQTGTLTDAVVTVEDSVDGSVYVDSTIDYLDIAAAVSDKSYKCELHSPVKCVKIKLVLADATNAATIKVLAACR